MQCTWHYFHWIAYPANAQNPVNGTRPQAMPQIIASTCLCQCIASSKSSCNTTMNWIQHFKLKLFKLSPCRFLQDKFKTQAILLLCESPMRTLYLLELFEELVGVMFASCSQKIGEEMPCSLTGLWRRKQVMLTLTGDFETFCASRNIHLQEICAAARNYRRFWVDKHHISPKSQ